MADTQLDATLSAIDPINGELSANDGINGSLTPDEEVAGALEVKRTRTVATMLSELEDVELDDLQDDDILVYDSLDGKWHNVENTGGAWGTITGDIEDQTDLQNVLNAKYNRSEANVLGAKNLLSTPYNLYNREGTTFVQNNLTFTYYDDGSIKINGTADASGSVDIHRRVPNNDASDLYLRPNTYRFVSDVAYRYYAGITYNGAYVSIGDTVTSAEEFEFEITQNMNCDYKKDDAVLVALYIAFSSGQVFDNVVVYPMVCLASDTDDTWQPYAMTNKELTDAVSQDASDIDAIKAVIPSSASTSNKLATASDIPDITGKADLVTSATSGDFAGLDANGNLTDSGISADIVPSGASSSNKLATASDIPSLTNYVEKSQTAGLLKNDGTVDTTQYVSDISGKVDNSVVAPVESGSTASQAYAIGKHFIRDGAFCTAKTAIALDDPFTLNTNYTVGDVANDLVYRGEINCGAIPANSYVEVEIPRYGNNCTITPRGWVDPSGLAVIIKTFDSSKWYVRVKNTTASAYSSGTIYLQWMQVL